MKQMKNSGIEWIGEIPSDWGVAKYKYFSKNRMGETILVNETSESGIPVYSATQDETYLGYVEKVKVLLQKDDIVIPARGNSIGFAKIVTTDKATCTQTTICSTNLHNIVPKFLYYCCYGLKEWWFRYDGSAIPQITVSQVENNILPYPPLAVQQSVANFLDQKCSEIDSLSSDIQSQIDILEEYKKSVITEAVTKGLNSEVEMKDSGIEWIGIIPKHWEVNKIKYHLKRNEPRNPGNVQVLSVYREYGVVPKNSRDDNHNVTSEDTSKYKYIRPGDLVINKMKAWQGSLAVSEYEGIVSPAYFVYNFTDKLFNKKYFHFLIRSCYKDEFRRISGGIREGQWDLPAEGFANELVLLPPINEQNAIVDYLDSKCAEIDVVIADKKAQLETLAEYKKSLIYEYVTGKKEVI